MTNPANNAKRPAQTVSVTLNLPLDVLTAIRQRATQQEEYPNQVIVDALRQGLGLTPPSTPASNLNDDLRSLAARLQAVEALLPRMQALEEQVSRLQAGRSSPVEDAASIEPPLQEPLPSTEAQQCPNCSHRLGPPLRASGRQVCGKCGWSNKPKRATSDSDMADLPADELRQILSNAASESLDNMKPKKQESGGSFFSRFGKR